MGKPKKGRKGHQDDEFGSDGETDVVAADNVEEKKPGGKKEKKGRRKKDDSDEDVANEVASLTIEDSKDDDGPQENGKEPPVAKAKKKKKGKKKFDSESEEGSGDDALAAQPVAPAPAKSAPAKSVKQKQSAFQMLAMSDDDDDPMQSDDDDDRGSSKTPPPSEDADFGSQAKAKKDKKKEKKKGKKADEEEGDLDALLAAIDEPAEKEGKKKKKGKKEENDEEEKNAEEEEDQVLPEGMGSGGVTQIRDISQMTQDEIAAMLDAEDDDDSDKKKKKKKKKGVERVEKSEEKEASPALEKEASLALEKEASPALEDVAEAEEEEEGDGTVKTAAQKKKEKKERQKLQKQQDKTKKKGGEAAAPVPAEPAAEVEAPQEEAEPAAEPKDEGDDEPDKKKKKDRKKKGKKEEEEEEKKKTKKPSKMVLAMQEALKAQKEEEERLKKEEEEAERREEEAQLAREEKERVEKEKKEREKQKKKDKIEKAKAEGKYLTAKQRESQRRAQQMLEQMKAQGLEVPTAGEEKKEVKKRVVYDNKKKKKAPSQEKETEPPTPPLDTSTPPLLTPTEDIVKVVGVATEEGVAREAVAMEIEEVADSWDQEEGTEAVKDDWDADTDEEGGQEPPTKTVEVAPAPPTVEAEPEEEEEEEEDEESEEESESGSDSESESSSEEEEKLTPAEKLERLKEKARDRIDARRVAAEAKRSVDKLRAPVVCVLGHVDTGKTKILDKLRRTNVQDGEAGGITQQIGATNVPESCIREQTKMCKEFIKKDLKIPGLLIIDTPGHESFANLRNRGSSLCDIAILVIDIMHGLEPQTLESIALLKKRKTPFVVALNKVDRLFQWQSNPHSDVQNTIKKQKANTKLEFDERVQQVVLQLAEQGLNACLFYDNKNPREYISLIPTSAHSGDGMGNLIGLICELTQTLLAKRLMWSEELQAITMEVKAIPGLGTTIDVILVNGFLREGATVVLAGVEGPIVTQIRGLLTTQPLKELRVKATYEHHKVIEAAQGVKLIAKDLEKGLAGLPMFVAESPTEIEIFKEEVEAALGDILDSIKLQERGVFVQASTLGSLEALLEFLRTSKIPYAGIGIGPVHRRDIIKTSVMLEHDEQFAVILAFDVKIERDAQEMAESVGVKIFTADIIYHLFDAFMAHRAELKRLKQEEFKHIAVFPCKLRILPQFIFNSRDPIVCGVMVEAGFLKEGTALCVPGQEFLEIGRVTSLEINHKNVDVARKGQEVCIKIEPIPGDSPKMVGRHFEITDPITSKISRESIDAVKNYFREEMGKSDWAVMIELKKLFQIL